VRPSSPGVGEFNPLFLTDGAFVNINTCHICHLGLLKVEINENNSPSISNTCVFLLFHVNISICETSGWHSSANPLTAN